MNQAIHRIKKLEEKLCKVKGDGILDILFLEKGETEKQAIARFQLEKGRKPKEGFLKISFV